MKRGQLVGGVLFLIAAALIFLFLESDASVPVASALAVVGIALIAVSRKRK